MPPVNEFQPLIVYTTSDQKELLESMGEHLVDAKLAACVQISGPVSSCYQWQGAVENSMEWQASIKTSKHKYVELEKTILKLHNYDEPQIIAVEIYRGSQAYLQWMAANLS